MITPLMMAILFFVIGKEVPNYVGYSCYVISILFAFHTVAMYKEYKQRIIDLNRGVNLMRLVQMYRYSHCQRQSLLFASMRTGHFKFVDDTYEKLGYRWYHLIPDWVFKNPLSIFTIKFWKRVFNL